MKDIFEMEGGLQKIHDSTHDDAVVVVFLLMKTLVLSQLRMLKKLITFFITQYIYYEVFITFSWQYLM